MHATALLAFSLWFSGVPVEPENILGETQECLVVITDSWPSTTGRMFLFERRPESPWQQHGSAIPVVLGKGGLGWGRGLTRQPLGEGPTKKEGDNRAPAGIFRLRSVFGYTRKNPGTKMPYIHLTNKMVAVNDPSSRYYNQMVDASQIKGPDWHSAETMVLGDIRYKWGVFVEHNTPAKPGAGSCIFLHVWKDSQTATAGCTALPEEDLVRIIHWLDPARHPLLVQMPRAVYDKLRAKEDLPHCQATF
jgi:L,D-peptidoglycan transpeptidase YkuD (ErfK/YbiS/YcfS/YnhG family)